MDTKAFSTALAKLKSQAAFIPGAPLRQMWILRFIKNWTGSHYASLFLADDLGRYNGGMLWPIGIGRLRLMAKLGPALNALLPASELFEKIWDSRPNRAFQIPEPFYTDSPLYTYVFREFDHRHVAVYGYPTRDDGNQPVVFACRPHRGAVPFEPVALAALERICGELEGTLASVSPAGPYLPRLATPDEHVLRLDPDCRPDTMPLYVRALLTLFYGPLAPHTDPTQRLPSALEHDIRIHRDDYLKSAYASDGGFFHAFTKAHRGRVLCLTVQSQRDGTMTLSVHEDLSRHKRLSRIKAACRELTRDRSRVFSACLLLEEGVTSADEIARRAGFAALKPSSAHQIVKQARRVLADLSPQ